MKRPIIRFMYEAIAIVSGLFMAVLSYFVIGLLIGESIVTFILAAAAGLHSFWAARKIYDPNKLGNPPGEVTATDSRQA